MAEAAKKNNAPIELAADAPPATREIAPDATVFDIFSPGKPYIPHKDIPVTIKSATTADFDKFRRSCRVGSMIDDYKETAEKNLKRPKNQKPIANAPAGETCVAILNQAASATLAGKTDSLLTKDQDIRYPYKKIAKDIGFSDTNEYADSLLTIFSNVSLQPETKDIKDKTKIEIDGYGVPFRPALALDVGYTTRVTESQAAGNVSVSRPIPPMQTLIAKNEQCQKAELSYNECFNVGGDLAATHLIKSGLLPAVNNIQTTTLPTLPKKTSTNGIN